MANIEVFMEKKEMTLTLDDSRKQTLGDLLVEITRLEGKDLRGMAMDEQGRSRSALRIVLNNELLLQDPFKAGVKDGDIVLMFPLIAGG